MKKEVNLTEAEQKLKESAEQFARDNKKQIAKSLTDMKIFTPEDEPVSVFMAGSPGAGKTEASIELLERIVNKSGFKILRIDPDELRSEFPDYTGENSWLFQGAVSILVNKILDVALNQKQSFLLDGTLSKYEQAEKNIERSLNKDRFVQILYVYQEPHLAWKFVQARELAEGRRIRPEDFIHQYFAARIVVNKLKLKFGKRVHVDLLLKNIDNSNRLYKAGIDQIDNHIPEKYTAADLEHSLRIV